jgi:hypothetical protein
MTNVVRVRIEGESYITLEGIAECFECERTWVIEVYEHGLLGSGTRYEGAMVVPTSTLERVAEIRRLHVYHGVALSAVAALLRVEY